MLRHPELASHYYGFAFPDTGAGSPGNPIAGGNGLYEFNPTTLKVAGGGKKPIVALPHPTGMAIYPQTGDLFMADQSDGIVRISGLPGHPQVTTFAAAGGNAYTDLAFNSTGNILYVTDRINFPNIAIQGFDRGGAQVSSVVDPRQGEGLAVAADKSVGGTDVSGNVFVNNNGTDATVRSSYGSITRIDTNNGDKQSIVASGGSRGGAVGVSSSGALLVIQTASVLRMSPAFFTPHRLFGGCTSGVAKPKATKTKAKFVRAASTIRGTVTSAGKRAHGLIVTLAVIKHGRSVHVASTRTDKKGAFSFEKITHDGSYTVITPAQLTTGGTPTKGSSDHVKVRR